MIINLNWSDSDELDTLLGEQFAGRNLVASDVEYIPSSDPNDVSYDMTILEDFLSQFITMFNLIQDGKM